jgi:hypothetical protein
MPEMRQWKRDGKTNAFESGRCIVALTIPQIVADSRNRRTRRGPLQLYSEAAGTVAEVRQLNYRGSRLKRPVHPAPQPSKPECDEDCSIGLALNYIPEGVCKGIACPICSQVRRIGVRQIAGDACDPLFGITVLCHAHTETE